MVARPKRVSGPVRAPFDPQVLIPYSQLVDLLEASDRLESIEDDVKSVKHKTLLEPSSQSL